MTESAPLDRSSLSPGGGGAWAAATDHPWFQARRSGSGVTIDGSPHALLGHRIELGKGRHPEGTWVEWSWDGRSLRVGNDRTGAYPVFYSASDDGIAISPSIDKLLSLGVSRELDLDALAAFLAVGYYVGDDTPFRAIRALPMDATLDWRPGGFTLESRLPTFTVDSMSRQAAVDGVVERVRASVERRIPASEEPYHLPLSGGRDSRHILLELRRLGRSPASCITTTHHPIDWGGDLPFAVRLCALLGIPHRALEAGPFVRSELRKNRLTSYVSDEHAWFLPVVDALTGATPYTYEGLGGGLLLRRAFMKRAVRRLSREHRWDELAAWMGKKDEGAARFTPLLPPGMRRELTPERATARLRKELERHLGSDEPYFAYVICTRSRREVALLPNALLSRVPLVYTPFMDSDVRAFASSIPAEHVDTSFHDDVIARAHPEVADVPFNPKRPPALDRRFVREVDRDLLRLLWESDGSLLDRPGLIARAAWGGITGHGWFAWGRRMALTVYLAQLGSLVGGRLDEPGATPD